jgi:hypothetical protein
VSNMTAADFELFQKFLAFQKMTETAPATSDATVAAVAADVVTVKTDAAPTSDETESTVNVTVGIAGGYGITGTDGVLYSVGSRNREKRGKLFSPFSKGETIQITLDSKGKATAVRSLIGAAPKTVAPKTVSKAPAAPAVTTAPATTTRKNGTVNPPCNLCDGPAHPHEKLAFLVCLSRQYTRETGQLVRTDEGFGTEFVAFAQWLAVTPRTAHAANTAGQKSYGGSTAAPTVKAAPPVKAGPPSPRQPSPRQPSRPFVVTAPCVVVSSRLARPCTMHAPRRLAPRQPSRRPILRSSRR